MISVQVRDKQLKALISNEPVDGKDKQAEPTTL